MWIDHLWLCFLEVFFSWLALGLVIMVTLDQKVIGPLSGKCCLLLFTMVTRKFLSDNSGDVGWLFVCRSGCYSDFLNRFYPCSVRFKMIAYAKLRILRIIDNIDIDNINNYNHPNIITGSVIITRKCCKVLRKYKSKNFINIKKLRGHNPGYISEDWETLSNSFKMSCSFCDFFKCIYFCYVKMKDKKKYKKCKNL